MRIFEIYVGLIIELVALQEILIHNILNIAIKTIRFNSLAYICCYFLCIMSSFELYCVGTVSGAIRIYPWPPIDAAMLLTNSNGGELFWVITQLGGLNYQFAIDLHNTNVMQAIVQKEDVEQLCKQVSSLNSSCYSCDC